MCVLDSASIFTSLSLQIVLHLLYYFCLFGLVFLFQNPLHQDRRKMVHFVLVMLMGTTSDIKTIETISGNPLHPLLQPASKTDHLSRREQVKIWQISLLSIPLLFSPHPFWPSIKALNYYKRNRTYLAKEVKKGVWNTNNRKWIFNN